MRIQKTAITHAQAGTTEQRQRHALQTQRQSFLFQLSLCSSIVRAFVCVHTSIASKTPNHLIPGISTARKTSFIMEKTHQGRVFMVFGCGREEAQGLSAGSERRSQGNSLDSGTADVDPEHPTVHAERAARRPTLSHTSNATAPGGELRVAPPRDPECVHSFCCRRVPGHRGPRSAGRAQIAPHSRRPCA